MANEKRLIDANALMDAFRGYMVERYDKEKCVSEENCKTCEASCLWRKIVSVAPTVDVVDAVEVVRCKGCKHWLHVEEGFGDCTNPRFHLPGHADPTMNADDFCSCGERRNEG